MKVVDNETFGAEAGGAAGAAGTSRGMFSLMLAAAFSSEATVGASDRGAATEKAAQARVVIIESEGKYIFEEGGAKTNVRLNDCWGKHTQSKRWLNVGAFLVFGDLLIYNIFAQ